MTNNDILRRIRYTFDFNDKTMIKVFGLAGCEVTREQVSAWLKQDEDPDFEACSDLLLATFLNGLIIETRGKREGPQPEPEAKLNNNIIFRKLKIALDLQADDILAILKLAEFELSKHELSAFFRKPEHKHYRECQEQILRKFLKGVQLKYRSKGKPRAAAEPKGAGVWQARDRSNAAARPQSKPKPRPKSNTAARSKTDARPKPGAKPAAKAKAKPKPRLSLSKK